uniref:Conserved secreted protein n=1 Tax=Panagrellus redivivus TaxID=6233 RepID=A0A7E4VMQ3_PANRE
MKKPTSLFLLFAIILVLGGSPRRFKSLASGAVSPAPHDKNNTNFEDRGLEFMTSYFVRFQAQFYCYNKPYGRHPDGSKVKVTFYEDDGENNHDFVQEAYLNDDGRIDITIKDYDDFFHPWLDMYMELDFDCYCKGFYQTMNSPWDKQSRNQLEAENNPFDQGIVSLVNVCKYPSMYRQNRKESG